MHFYHLLNGSKCTPCTDSDLLASVLSAQVWHRSSFDSDFPKANKGGITEVEGKAR